MYFHQTKYCSNSDLSELKRLLSAQGEKVWKGNNLNFGSLVHAKLIEEEKVVECEAFVSEEEKNVAELMAQAGRASSFLNAFFIEGSKFEHEIYRNAFEVEFEGDVVTLPIRVKLDLYRRSNKIGGDIKTTACKGQQSFVNSIFFFEYHRQAAFYMDAARLDQFVFIGIGKTRDNMTKKFPVFYYVIQRGDEAYNSGKKLYSRLAYKYYFLIHQLQLNGV